MTATTALQLIARVRAADLPGCRVTLPADAYGAIEPKRLAEWLKANVFRVPTHKEPPGIWRLMVTGYSFPRDGFDYAIAARRSVRIVAKRMNRGDLEVLEELLT